MEGVKGKINAILEVRVGSGDERLEFKSTGDKRGGEAVDGQ